MVYLLVSHLPQEVSMVVNSTNSYIADELANKVKHLHIALTQAKEIIDTLEAENIRLNDVLKSLASEHNGDLILDSEAICV
jgi:ABC-type transporter Mla subunit MlaD